MAVRVGVADSPMRMTSTKGATVGAKVTSSSDLKQSATVIDVNIGALRKGVGDMYQSQMQTLE